MRVILINDNEFVMCRYVYSLDYGRTLNTSLAHDDAVSQLSMHENLLVSSSCDSTVKVNVLIINILHLL